MKNAETKRRLLYMLQDGKDPLTDQPLRTDDGMDLHHAVRPDTIYWRRRWPQFLDSLLNLQLVAHGPHMNSHKPRPRIVTDAQVDALEAWLEDHPYERNILTGSAWTPDLGKVRKMIQAAWEAVGV